MVTNSGGTNYVIRVKATGVTSELNQLIVNLAKADVATARLTDANRRAATAADRAAKAQAAVGVAATRSATQMNQAGSAMQRWSYFGQQAVVQFGDLSTQLAMGGGIAGGLRATSQQGLQLAGTLAAMGGRLTAVGIAFTGLFAVLPALRGFFEEGASLADQFADKMDSLTKSVDSYVSAQGRLEAAVTGGDWASSTLALAESRLREIEIREKIVSAIADTATDVQGLIGIPDSWAASAQKLADQIEIQRKQKAELDRLMTQITTSDTANQDALLAKWSALNEEYKVTARRVTELGRRTREAEQQFTELGFTAEEAAEGVDFLLDHLDELSGVKGIEAQTEAAAHFAEWMLSTADGAGLLDKNLRAVLERMLALAGAGKPFLDRQLEMERSAERLVGWLNRAIGLLSGLANGISALASSPLATIKSGLDGLLEGDTIFERVGGLIGRLNSWAQEAGVAAENAGTAVAEGLERGLSGGGGAGGRNVINEQLEAFTNGLNQFRTEAEKLDAELTALRAGVERFGNSMSEVEHALAARGIEELEQRIRDLNSALSDMGEAVEDGFQTLFDGLIDGSKSASEAFGDMLTKMLNDITSFLFSQQLQNFLGLLSQQQGFGWMNAGTGTLSAAANISAPPITRTVMQFSDPNAQIGLGRHVANVTPARPIPLAHAGSRAVQQSSTTVNLYGAPAGTEVEESISPNGEKQIDVYIKAAVKGMIGDGSLDKQLRSSFGIRRRVG